MYSKHLHCYRIGRRPDCQCRRLAVLLQQHPCRQYDHIVKTHALIILGGQGNLASKVIQVLTIFEVPSYSTESTCLLARTHFGISQSYSLRWAFAHRQLSAPSKREEELVERALGELGPGPRPRPYPDTWAVSLAASIYYLNRESTSIAQNSKYLPHGLDEHRSDTRYLTKNR